MASLVVQVLLWELLNTMGTKSQDSKATYRYPFDQQSSWRLSPLLLEYPDIGLL